jgi:carotenoid cleavage dioxygenase-like enzyme
MPRTGERYQTRPYRYGYVTLLDPERPLNVASTIGVGWNTLARVDLATGTMARWYAGDRTTLQEPQFVPRSPDAPEGDGWLLSVLTRVDGDWRTEVGVFDAQRIAQGPVARIRMPFRIRGAVHGTWVDQALLAA